MINTSQTNKNPRQKTLLKLVQLGVMVTMQKLSSSPLLKYRSICKKDPATDKSYQVAIVLRQNGRFEVYSDFVRVYEYYNPNKQCVDVECDFDKFALKFVKKSLEVKHENKVEDLNRNWQPFYGKKVTFIYCFNASIVDE